MKANRIPLIAHEQKKLYTWFLVIAVALFAAATVFPISSGRTSGRAPSWMAIRSQRG